MAMEGDKFTIVPEYNKCVLIGNWMEERAKIKREIVCTESEYTDEYRPKRNDEYIQRQGESIDNELKFKQSDVPFHSGIPCYCENYTSSYDLHYEILPCGLCGPRPRKYLHDKQEYDEIDPLGCFGNYSKREDVRRRGLKHQEDADCEKLGTTMFNDYQPFAPDDYEKVRFTICPTELSITSNPVTDMLKDINLRGMPLRIVPEGPIDVEFYEKQLLANPRLRHFVMKPLSG